MEFRIHTRSICRLRHYSALIWHAQRTNKQAYTHIINCMEMKRMKCDPGKHRAHFNAKRTQKNRGAFL